MTNPTPLVCHVRVTGEASDPEDVDVAGVYRVDVHLAPAADPAALSPTDQDEIAERVLDALHAELPIAELDDFDIAVVRADGTPLERVDGDAGDGLVESVRWHGRVAAA